MHDPVREADRRHRARLVMHRGGKPLDSAAPPHTTATFGGPLQPAVVGSVDGQPVPRGISVLTEITKVWLNTRVHDGRRVHRGDGHDHRSRPAADGRTDSGLAPHLRPPGTHGGGDRRAAARQPRLDQWHGTPARANRRDSPPNPTGRSPRVLLGSRRGVRPSLSRPPAVHHGRPRDDGARARADRRQAAPDTRAAPGSPRHVRVLREGVARAHRSVRGGAGPRERKHDRWHPPSRPRS